MPRTKKPAVTGEQIVRALAAIAFEEPEAKPSERMKALELLGKHLGLWKDPPGEDGLAAEQSKLEELLQQRRERGDPS